MESTLPSKPKRPRLRWFQFRLRTLFVVMMLFAVWFGNEMNFIRQRAALSKQIEAAGGFVEKQSFWISAMYEGTIQTGDGLGEIPAFRRWLGDRPAAGIYLPPSFSEADSKRAMECFPESQIVRDPKQAHSITFELAPIIKDLDATPH